MEHQLNKIKYGGGIRVSSQKQAISGDSKDDQKIIISKYAQEHGGYIERWFDFVHSATNKDIEKQPFLEVIDYCKSNPGAIDCLVVCKIDRFTRGGVEVYDKLKRELSKYGVRLVDTEGVIGNIEIDTLAHLGLNYSYPWAIQNPTRENELKEAQSAESEAVKIARRLIGAEIRYTQNGYWMRRPPYGLQSKEIITNTGKRKILIPADNDEYRLIKMIFDLANRGNLTDSEIVDQVNTQGYRSRQIVLHETDNPMKIIGKKGGVKLTVEQLRKYLSNPIYAGVICEKWTNFKPIKASFEGIITIDEFNKINKGRVYIHQDDDGVLTINKGLVAEWRKKKLKDNPKYAYKKYVLCPICGNRFLGSATTGKLGKKHPAYHCSRGHKRFGVKKSLMDQVISDFVSSIDISTDFKSKLLARIRDEWIKREKGFNQQALDINRQIVDIDRQIEDLIDNYSSTSSNVIKEGIEKKIENLNSQKMSLAQKRNTTEICELDMNKIINCAKYYMEHLPELLISNTNPLENASFFGLLFDELPTYNDLVNGTPKLSCIFKLNEAYKKSESQLVTLRGIGHKS